MTLEAVLQLQIVGFNSNCKNNKGTLLKVSWKRITIVIVSSFWFKWWSVLITIYLFLKNLWLDTVFQIRLTNEGFSKSIKLYTIGQIDLVVFDDSFLDHFFRSFSQFISIFLSHSVFGYAFCRITFVIWSLYKVLMFGSIQS